MPGIDLEVLLPRAIAWAERCAEDALLVGSALNQAQSAIAVGVGVRQPERVRVRFVDSMPFPEDVDLRRAAMATGLLGAGGLGLTLGYAVFLRKGRENDTRLLRHELRHVQQCEQCGSLAAFLTEYLDQILRCGYDRAPLEEDARAHETDMD